MYIGQPIASIVFEVEASELAATTGDLAAFGNIERSASGARAFNGGGRTTTGSRALDRDFAIGLREKGRELAVLDDHPVHVGCPRIPDTLVGEDPLAIAIHSCDSAWRWSAISAPRWGSDRASRLTIAEQIPSVRSDIATSASRGERRLRVACVDDEMDVFRGKRREDLVVQNFAGQRSVEQR